jgi:hypothetical protein
MSAPRCREIDGNRLRGVPETTWCSWQEVYVHSSHSFLDTTLDSPRFLSSQLSCEQHVADLERLLNSLGLGQAFQG